MDKDWEALTLSSSLDKLCLTCLEIHQKLARLMQPRNCSKPQPEDLIIGKFRKDEGPFTLCPLCKVFWTSRISTSNAFLSRIVEVLALDKTRLPDELVFECGQFQFQPMSPPHSGSAILKIEWTDPIWGSSTDYFAACVSPDTDEALLPVKSRKLDFSLLESWLEDCRECRAELTSCGKGPDVPFCVINCTTRTVLPSAWNTIFCALSYVCMASNLFISTPVS
jgi:hypothetical protein